MIKYTLGDVVKVISKRVDNPSNCEYDKFVGLEHYVSGEIEIKKYGDTSLLKSAMKVFKSGDILIARRNVYLKRASIVNFDGITSGDSIVLRTEDNLLRRIIPFILNTDDFWGYAEKFSDGTMSKRLSPKVLLEYEFSLPEKDKQEKLSELLWAFNNTKEAYKKLIYFTDELIESKFIEMFGLPTDNAKGFDKGTIRDVVSEVKYGTSKPASDGGQFPYLRMNNITYDGKLDLTDLKFIDISEQEIEKYIVRKGDILFNRTNSKELVGKTCMFNLDKPMIIAGYIIRVRVNDKLLPEYLSTFLNLKYSKNSLFEMCKSAIGQANINAQELQDIEIIIPPVCLQYEFLDLLHRTDKSKLELKQALVELDATCKKIIHENIA
ncbi:restriction endonuclease subunit S [Paenibacillus sp. FSL R7-0026]|uniref:restriction endonuclease subunit S n=1 Tax=Paenibacillus sp. FSL R7-0026 TaxID=2921668 RepID=UPI0030F506E7